MPLARKRQVHLDTTPYYHCTARCVRRAFLCGRDRFSGRSFNHRRRWIIDRAKTLSSVFAIDLCGYAIMENHYHLLIHIDQNRGKQWDATEVIERYARIFRCPETVRRWVRGETLTQFEQEQVCVLIDTWRQRLMDISWYMRCLNEYVARRANREDDCTGRFWQGRFKSQALLDARALLTCMLYIDLNPVRAGIASSLRNSAYTSICERLQSRPAPCPDKKPLRPAKPPEKASLLPFTGTGTKTGAPGIPYHFDDYLALAEWSCTAILSKKNGIAPAGSPPLLKTMNLPEKTWIEQISYYGVRFKGVVGALEALKRFSARVGKRWVHGKQACALLYGNAF